MIGLGDLSGGSFFSLAHGVSADGLVVVGISDSALGEQAFRWTQPGGMVGLGFLPRGIESDAFGVSADGSIVVGRDKRAGSAWTRFERGAGLRQHFAPASSM